jgi:pyrimidine operon attenuation protein/uracil phosphoribosyltransferase
MSALVRHEAVHWVNSSLYERIADEKGCQEQFPCGATCYGITCSQSARAANVQGAFRVPADGKPEVAGRRLVLVDDVLTSGATVDNLH